jgi:hypothetical protein
MAGATSIPAAIAGAYDLIVAALAVPKPDVTVHFGPETVGDSPRTYVVVGYSEDENEASIQGNTERYGGEGTPMEEYAIACYISTWDGDPDDLRQKLIDTAEVYNLVTAAVRADRTLSGAIQPPGLAELGGFAWVLDQAEDGAIAQVNFDIRVTSAVLW